MKKGTFKKLSYSEVLEKRKQRAIRQFKVPQNKEDADIVYTSFRKPRGKKPTKKRHKATPLKKLKKALWELCKQIVRKRDGNSCFICGKANLEGAGWHTGHFVPSSTCGVFLRYDLRNLHSSCYYCNINLGGNGAMFYRRLEEIYGKDFLESIFRDKQLTTKADSFFYEDKIKKYQEISEWDKVQILDYTKVCSK